MSLAVRQGLYQKLATTSAITSQLATAAPGYDKAIYHEQAPPTAEYPCVIFAKAAGVKTRTFSDPEAFKRETWMVKAVDRNTTSNLAEGIAVAIDDLLDGGSFTVAGKTVADLAHVGDIDYPESSGDQLFRHNGANYRVVLT